MELTGILLEVQDEVQHTERFVTKNIIIGTDHKTQYPQEIIMQLQNNKTTLTDKIPLGVEVNIKFTIRGRSWVNNNEKKYFNTLVVNEIVMTHNRG